MEHRRNAFVLQNIETNKFVDRTISYTNDLTFARLFDSSENCEIYLSRLPSSMKKTLYPPEKLLVREVHVRVLL